MLGIMQTRYSESLRTEEIIESSNAQEISKQRQDSKTLKKVKKINEYATKSLFINTASVSSIF